MRMERFHATPISVHEVKLEEIVSEDQTAVKDEPIDGIKKNTGDKIHDTGPLPAAASEKRVVQERLTYKGIQDIDGKQETAEDVVLGDLVIIKEEPMDLFVPNDAPESGMMDHEKSVPVKEEIVDDEFNDSTVVKEKLTDDFKEGDAILETGRVYSSPGGSRDDPGDGRSEKRKVSDAIRGNNMDYIEKKCTSDIKKYESRRDGVLKINMMTHPGERFLACYTCNHKFCDYQCSQADVMKRHMATHTEKKVFAVCWCGYQCILASDLKKHLVTHDEKPFACGECDYECSQADNLKNHMITHTGEKPLVCDVCDYKCIRTGDLTKHMKTHSGMVLFTCGICDFECKRTVALTEHMMTHVGKKLFACEFCHYVGGGANSLKRHMLTHTGKRHFACDICDYKCILPNDLKEHMKTHTLVKLLSCKKCRFKCIQANNLKKHMKTHTRLILYSCNQCDYKTSVARNWEVHMLTHEK